MKKQKFIWIVILFLSIISTLFAQEPESSKDPFLLFLPIGYEHIRMDGQTVHSPAAGIGFMYGEQDLPYDQVDRSFFGMAMYQPAIFTEMLHPDVPKMFHQIMVIFDGRIERHWILFVFQSASDKPVAGGLNTFLVAAGWGYEIIRTPNISLLLGVGPVVNDFGITMSSGNSWPVLPLPIFRFNVNTHWFRSALEYLDNPAFNFTIAPKEKIRFTGDIKLNGFQSISDLICEFIIEYRFFDAGHRLGDFGGIGVGFKHDSINFDLSRDIIYETIELRQTSVFAELDLSLIRLRGGRIIDSVYLVDERRTGSPGSGFFLSVQGFIPIMQK